VENTASTGTTYALRGVSSATATADATYGVSGEAASQNGIGVYGLASAASGFTIGVLGDNASEGGAGVLGQALATSGTATADGVLGVSYSRFGPGVRGVNAVSGILGPSGVVGEGVDGVSAYGSSTGLFASVESYGQAVWAIHWEGGNPAWGVRAENRAETGFNNYGVEGHAWSTEGKGVYGVVTAETGSPIGVYGRTVHGVGYAGYFDGPTEATAAFSAANGTSKIDHPLDPENRVLRHAFVESPEMKTVYDGNVTTDARGYATVALPSYFEALNREFRYQLTVIGPTFAQAIVTEEVRGNRFVIRTSEPNVRVSWQVTGIRQDAWANENRVIVEEEKPAAQRGRYLQPSAFGLSRERGVNYNAEEEAARARTSEERIRIEEERARMREARSWRAAPAPPQSPRRER
jgi:hypothetical protein